MKRLIRKVSVAIALIAVAIVAVLSVLKSHSAIIYEDTGSAVFCESIPEICTDS